MGTTSGSGYNPQNRGENHETERTEEMGVVWVRAVGVGGVVYCGVALCGCGRSWPPLEGGGGCGWAGQGEHASAEARLEH